LKQQLKNKKLNFNKKFNIFTRVDKFFKKLINFFKN